jgi:ADP-heptose:LPS heptosyltransferase
VILQHDNTEAAYRILELRKTGLPIYAFYTNYRFSKHGPLSPFDFAFNEGETMVDNTRKAVETLFGGKSSGQNCLRPPTALVHRKEKRRVLIHSTSTSSSKNWLKKRYLLVAKRLQELGFEPFFLEPELPTLEDLASLTYESGAFIGNDSGPAHLASYLSIPHITLAPKIDFWRPGWLPGERITPPFHLRGNKWKYFITTEMVLSSFRSIIELNKNLTYY